VGPAAVVADAVRVEGLEKSYRRRPAVRGMDLAVRSGEIYGLIGPDGAGKSTLLKTIAGVLRFDAGTVVDVDMLIAAGLVSKRHDAVKILGKGSLDRALTVRAHAFSASAKRAIEGAGGKTESIAQPEPQPEA